MYFKSKYCNKCGAKIDEMLDFCPFCGTRNLEHEDFKKKHPLTFFPISRQLFLAGAGLIGLTLFSVLFTLIFNNVFPTDPITKNILVVSLSYALFFIFVVLSSFPFYKSLLLIAKKWDGYIFGIIGAGVLIGGTYLINYIMGILYPPLSPGGNQGTINVLVKAFPVISIIIFSIIGPICEEFAYRVGLFTFFRRIHPLLAYLGTAIIFAFIHFDYTAADIVNEFAILPSYLWGGLVFSVLYDYKGAGASTTAHIINNLVSIIIILVI